MYEDAYLTVRTRRHEGCYIVIAEDKKYDVYCETHVIYKDGDVWKAIDLMTEEEIFPKKSTKKELLAWIEAHCIRNDPGAFYS